MTELRHLEPLPERYVTRGELAEVFNVSVDTIDRMRKAGMPSTLFGKKSRRFKVSQAEAWIRRQGRMAA